MVKPTKRIAAGAGAVALAAGAMLAMAPQAYAGEIKAKVSCQVPVVGPKSGDQTIKVEVNPATAAAGSEVTLSISLGPSPATSPLDLKGVKLTPSIEFKIGTATATATGPTTTIDVAANAPITPAPYSAKLKIPAGLTGTVDLIPVKMNNDTDVPGFGKQPTPCTITGATKVASITISGGATTGTTTGTNTTGTNTTTTSTSTTGGAATSTSSTGGDLAKTGPMDDALSLGLVGGTVGLLGVGAVLIATRKVRASRGNTA